MATSSELDQFFTPDELAEYCVQFFKEASGETDIKIVEPCAGAKAFARAFEVHGYRDYELFDLDPKSEDIQHLNFFRRTETLKGKAMITNPPFGRASQMSKDFFNKAASLEAQYIAMLTLANHGTARILNHINAYYELLDEVYIKSDFLTPEGTSAGMADTRLVFQVWRKSENIRPLLLPKKRLWVSDKYEEADFWMRGCSEGNAIYTSMDEFINDDIHYQSKIPARTEVGKYSKIIDGETRFLSPNLLGYKKLPEVSIDDIREAVKASDWKSWNGYYVYPAPLNQFLDEYYSGKTFKTVQF